MLWGFPLQFPVKKKTRATTAGHPTTACRRFEAVLHELRGDPWQRRRAGPAIETADPRVHSNMLNTSDPFTIFGSFSFNSFPI